MERIVANCSKQYRVSCSRELCSVSIFPQQEPSSLHTRDEFVSLVAVFTVGIPYPHHAGDAYRHFFRSAVLRRNFGAAWTSEYVFLYCEAYN